MRFQAISEILYIDFEFQSSKYFGEKYSVFNCFSVTIKDITIFTYYYNILDTKKTMQSFYRL